MRSWSLLALAVALAGCARDAAAPVVSVRDSAGVEIVESAAPTWGPGEGWSVAAEPFLDLTATGHSAAHEFYRVADARRLPDGGVAVALPTEVRLFSGTGAHRVTLGGEGDGPGEFRSIVKLGRLDPDSLVVYDRRRVAVFDPDGRLARTARVEAASPGFDGFVVVDGGFLITEYHGPFTEENLAAGIETGVRREPMPLVALSPTGEVLDTLLMTAGYESAVMRSGDGVADGAAVLGRATHLAVLGRHLYLGDATEFEYTVRTLGGALERIVRGSRDLTLKPEVVRAEFLARYGPDPSPSALEAIRDWPRPDRMPAYRELRVDGAGAVWLAEHRGRAVYETSPSANAWDVFSPDGEWLGRVHTPGRFRVLEIGLDYVLGVRRDELDVEHVELRALNR